MSLADAQPPPAKKRRFFVEASPVAERSLDAPSRSTSESHGALDHDGRLLEDDGLRDRGLQTGTDNVSATNGGAGFDMALFESVTGDSLDRDGIRRLHEASGGNLERGRCPIPDKASFASLTSD